MPHTGGFSPAPRRNGGAKPNLEIIQKSIATSLGAAYDTATTTGPVWIRMMAYARAIWAAWEQNQRLSNQWDPQRMTDFLPRWETILGLFPLPTDTMTQRRARIAVAMGRVGYARQQDVTDALMTILGANFVGITITASASANVWTPPTWPMGQHAPPNPDGSLGSPDWYSSVAYIAIQVKQLPNQTNAQFYALCCSIYPVLDAILPAWVTFAWFRQDVHGSAGFYLDELNLDQEAFNV